ncbi:hypothetical protein HGA88_00245 [Candidatus Roizmanbacteria bacterium]|nr:hypothetical protein [Candidatus Roizmanbacteria bacterium]
MIECTPEIIRSFIEELLKKDTDVTIVKRKISSIENFLEWAYGTGKIAAEQVWQLKQTIAEMKDELSKAEKERTDTKTQNIVSQETASTSFRLRPESLLGIHLPLHYFSQRSWSSQDDNRRKQSKFDPRKAIGFVLLLLLVSTMGAGVYDRFFKKATTPLAYPSILTRAGRLISFQGRMTDTVGNPITAKTDVLFKLYNVATGGTPLYTGTCQGVNGVSPDVDGIFNVNVGSDCGMAEIPSSVFTENTNVYLGVTVGSDAEMSPRQQIANVGYAINAETLQGLPPGQTTSSIPYISNTGDLLIAAATPAVRSTLASANFTLSSANSITIQSAGSGDVVMVATESGTLRFRTGGNTDVYTRMVVDNLGNVGIGTTAPSQKLEVAGNIYANGGQIRIGNFGSEPTAIGSGSMYYNTGTSQLYYYNGSSWNVLATGASAQNLWTLSNGALYPANLTSDVLLGGTATSSAKFAFMNMNSGNPTASISGNLAIGNATGNTQTAFMNVLNGGAFNLQTSVGGDAGLSSRLYVANNGNIGIGTNSPLAKLDIAGDASASGSFVMRGTSTNVIKSLNGGRLDFATSVGGDLGLTTQMSLLQNGFLGLGTTAPLYQFDQYGTQNDYLSRIWNASTGDSAAGLFLRVDGNGNLLTLNSNGSDIMTVSNTGANFNVPTSFNAAGDVSMAYDLIFSNPISSFIKSAGALTIQSGDTFSSMDLTLNTFNNGDIVLDPGRFTYVTKNLGVGTNNPLGRLHVSTDLTNLTGAAALIVDQLENQDILTASSSGVTKFVINNAGNVGIGTTLPGYSLDVNGNLNVASTTTFNGQTYSWPGNTGSNGYALVTNGSGTLSWANASSLGTNYWNLTNGALFPMNSTTDLLIGGTSTSSAKFAFINNASGSPTASISGNLALGNATGNNQTAFLNVLNGGAFNLQTSVGGDAGLASRLYVANNGYIGVGITNPSQKLQVNGTIALTAAGQDGSQRYYTYPDANHSWYYNSNLSGKAVDVMSYYQNFRFRLADSTDVLSLDQGGNVGIGTTAPLAKLDIAGDASASGSFVMRGTSTNVIKSLNGGRLDFATSVGGDLGLTTQMSLLQNGFLGLGTTAPAYQFDQYGSQNDYLSRIWNASTGDSAGGLFLRVDGNGNLLTLNSNGSDIMTVSSTGANFNVPTSFNAAGDVSIANDLLFTDMTASFIKSHAPLTIQSGESYESSPLTLNTFNSGDIILDAGGNTIVTKNLGVGTSAPLGRLHVATDLTNLTGASALIVDQLENQDILTASSSGVTKFVINNAGNVGIGTTLPGYSLDVNGNLNVASTTTFNGQTYTWPSGPGSSNYALTTNGSGTLSWASASSLGTNYWNLTNGALFPMNSTADLLVGGTSTSSAKFAFMNVNSGSPTASISGNLSLGNATGNNQTAFLNVLNGGAFNLQTSVGGDAGLASRLYVANNGNVGIGTTSPNAKLALAMAGGASITSAYTNTAIRIKDTNIGSGAKFGISWEQGDIGSTNTLAAIEPTVISGWDTSLDFYTRQGGALTNSLHLDRAGNVGIGTTSPLAKLDVAGDASASGSFVMRGTSTNVIKSLNGGRLDFATSVGGDLGLTTQMSLLQNGFLGLGTTAPSYQFDQYGTQNDYLSRIWNASTGDSAAGLFLRVDGNGNLLTLNSNGSDIMTVSSTGANFNVPTSFNAAGDVSMAYDLIFTNSVASYIKSAAPLYIQAGDSYSSTDLTLNSFNSGNIVLDPGANVLVTKNLGVGTSSPLGRLHVATDLTNLTGAAALIVDQLENQDILTASSSGVTKFVINNAGNVGIGTSSPTQALDVVGNFNLSGTTTFNGQTYTWPSGPGSSNYALTTNGSGTLSWASASSLGTNYWNLTNGALFSMNSTADLLVGGTSTASAKFAFINNAAGSPTASISGNLALGNATGNNQTAFLNVLNGGAFNLQTSVGGDAGLASRFYVANNGYIGIGTTTPAYNLDVVGSGKFTGNIGASQFAALSNGTTINPAFRSWGDSNTGVYFPALHELGFVTNGNERVRFDSNGNVGIGTTSPLAKLDVAGNVNFQGYATASASLAVGYNSVLGGVGNAAFSGNVGIGTTNPGRSLDILASSANGNEIARFTNVNSNQYFSVRSISSSDFSNTYVGGILLDSNMSEMLFGKSIKLMSDGSHLAIGQTTLSSSMSTGALFQVGGATALHGTTIQLGNDATYQGAFKINDGPGNELLRLTTAGNLGIGTTAPAQKLDVVGNIKVSGTTTFNGQTYTWPGASGSNGYALVTNGSGTLSWASASGLGTNYWNLINGALMPQNTSTDLLLGGSSTASAKFAFINNAAGSPTASISGNLALGNATGNNQTAFLNVLNGGAFNLQTSVGGDAGLNSRLYVANNGNVGIGTTSPGFTLHVYNTLNNRQAVFESNRGADTGIQFKNQDRKWSVGTNLYGAGIGNFSIFDDTAVANRFVIDTAGNIGIGTTTPTSKLDISGDASASGSFVMRGTSTNVIKSLNGGRLDFATSVGGDAGLTTQMSLLQNGFLGLGTTAPLYQFDQYGSQNDYLSRIWNANTGSSAGGLFIRVDGTGNLLTLNNNGSDIMTVSPTNTTFNTPTSFTSAGDVSVSYDMLFANPTSSTIKSLATLNIQSGESYDSSDLYLRTYNYGDIVLDAGTNGPSGAGSIKFNDSNVKNATDTTPIGFATGSAEVNTFRSNFASTQSILGALNTAYNAAVAGTGGIWNLNGSNLYPSSTSYNVGIGTTAPGSKLDVAGNVNFQGYATASASLAVGYNSVLGGIGNGVFSGNVGVGTSNPTQKLTVVGGQVDVTAPSAGANLFAGRISGDGYDRVNIDSYGNVITFGGLYSNFFSTKTATQDTKFILPSAGYNLNFRNNADSSSLISITGAGNVGIGTTSPGYPLDVTGSIRATSSLIADPGAGSANASLVLTGRNAGVGSSAQLLADWNGGLTINPKLGQSTRFNYNQSGTGGTVQFYDGQTNEIMRVQQNGNVGIGTTNPSGTLHIGRGQLLIANGTASLPSIASAAKPNSGLNIDPTYGDFIMVVNGIQRGSLNGSGTLSVSQVNAAHAMITGTDSLNTTIAMNVSGSANTGLVVTNAGNVGIGTTSPGQKLDIAGGNILLEGTSVLYLGTSAQSLNQDGYGNINLSNTQSGKLTTLATTGSGAHIILQPGGNVGIGTTNPLQKLDVAGNFQLSGTTTFNSQTYTWPGNTGSNGYALVTNGSGTLSWASASGLGTNYWNLANGALSPMNSTTDLLVGGTSTASAKFAFLNVNSGTPTASIGGVLSLDANGTIQTTAMKPMVLGSSTTGSVQLSPKGTTGLFVDGTGNVGVGTTGPSYELDVTGTINASSTLRVNGLSRISSAGTFYANTGSAGSPGITFNGSTTVGLYRPAANTLGLVTSGAEQMRIDSTGNVGIGTTSPGAKLEVAGAIKTPTTGTLIYNDTNATGNPGSDSFRMKYDSNFYGTNADGLIFEKTDANGASPDGGISFINTGNTGVTNYALTIRGDGNVGIGTTAPGSTLDVNGTLHTANTITVDSGSGSNNAMLQLIGRNGGTANTASIYADYNGNLNIAPANGGLNLSGVSSLSIDKGSGSSNATLTLTGRYSGTGASGSLTANYLGGIILSSAASQPIGLSPGGSTAMTLLSNGNVGIGTTAPAQKLDVVGNFQLSGTTTFNGQTYTWPGNTGSNGYALVTNGSGTLSWATASGLGTNYWNLANGALSPLNSTADLLVGGTSTASAKFAFMNNAAGSPTASISGNLAIGNATGNNQTAFMNVLNGGAFNLQTSVGGDAGLASRFYVANNGNVGIGTTSPIAKLDLQGNLNVSGGLYNNFSNWSPNILQTRTNLMNNTSYDGSAFTGWSNQTPSYLTRSNPSPGSGFSSTVLRWDATGGAQGQRDWASGGAQSAEFILNHTYRVSFKYRSGGPFTIRDRDTTFATVPANATTAKVFSFDYTKTVDSWSNRNFLVNLVDSSICPWVEMDEISIEDITSPTYTIAAYANSTGNVGIGTTNPAAALQINTSVGGTDALIFRDTTNSANARVYFTTPAGSAPDINLDTGSGRVIFPGYAVRFKRIEPSTGTNLDAFFTTLKLGPGSNTNMELYASSVGGTAPEIRATGSDTNINLALIPKGTGGVGIGTTAPSAKLTVVSTSNNTAVFDTTGSNGGSISFAGTGTQFGYIGGASGLLSNGNNNDLAIRSENNIYFSAFGSTTKMAILSNGSVGIGTTVPVEKLDVNGDLKINNMRTRTMTRTLPTTVNDEVDIGTFTLTNGGGSFDISITVPSSGFSVAKEYLLPIKYNQTTNTWTTALPTSSTGSYSSNDFDLDVNVNGSAAMLRLRRTLGSTGGTAYIVIKQEGVNTDTFTASTNTSSVSAPTGYFGSTALTQVNGNVGIGTLTPGALLSVGSTNGFQVDTNGNITKINGAVTSFPSTNASGYLKNNGSGTLTWDNSLTASSMAWSSLTAPVANLSLNMSTYTTGFNWATGTGTNNLFSLTSDASANGTGTLLNLQTGASSTLMPLRVRAGSTEALTVNSSGNVGIGTTSPGNRLQVEGGSAEFATNTNAYPLIISRNHKVSNFEELRVGLDDANTYFNYINDESSSRLSFRLQNTDTETGGGVSANDNTILTLAGSSTGYGAGIGTTNPLSRLDVNGGVAVGSYAGNNAAPSNGLIVSGNVGIGTTNPNYKMDIASGGKIALGSQPNQDKIYLYSTTYGLGIDSSDLVLFTNNTTGISFKNSSYSGSTMMRIMTNGNVGIGTTSPGSALDVAGAIRSTGDMVPGGNGVTRAVVPLAMPNSEIIINSPGWQRVTKTNYAAMTNLFSGVSTLPGATRKYYLVIRKGDDQPGGNGSNWRFACDSGWNGGTDIPGHGFSLVSNWGNIDEGSTNWVEIPPTAVSGASCSSYYWKIDAQMANPGQKMKIMSVSMAAVDVYNGTNIAYSAATGGNDTNPLMTAMNNALIASSSGNLAVGFSTNYFPTNKFEVNGNMYIGNGNLGIGTTAPGYKLDIQGGTGIVGQFSGRVIGANAVNTNEFVTLGQMSSSNLWTRLNGVLSPATSSDVVAATSSATTVGTFTSTGTNTALRAGGTGAYLSVDASGNLTFTNSGTATIGASNNLTIGATGVLTLNAHTLGGDITGNSKNITGVNQLGSATLGVGYTPSTIANGVAAFNGNVGIGTTSPNYKLAIGNGTHQLGVYSDGANGYINASSGNLKLDSNAIGNVTIGEDTQVSDTANGSALSIYRKAAEGNDLLTLNIDSYQVSRIAASRHFALGSGVGYEIAAQSPLTIGHWTNGNTTFKQYGYITAATAEKYVQWQVSDTTDNYELTRQDSNIGYLDIQMPALFSGGNVGIGTTAPAQKLDVVGNFQLSGTTTFNSQTYTWPGNAGSNGAILSTNGSGTLSWTSPASLGTNYWNQANGALSPLNSTVDMFIGGTASSSAKFAFMNVNSGSPTASISGNLALGSPTGTNQTSFLNVLNGGNFNLKTSGGGDAGLASRLYVANNGNVGVGTTSPLAKLDVAGAATISGNLTFYGGPAYIATRARNTLYIGDAETGAVVINPGANATPPLTITADGNVGIGTPYDGYKLSVDGAIRATAFWDTIGGYFLDPANSGTSLITAGKIGIGNISPTEMLDVTGNATISGNLTFNGARTIASRANNALTIGDNQTGNIIVNPNGNLGIGTTTPGFKLDVNGSIRGATIYQGSNQVLDAGSLTGTTNRTAKFTGTNSIGNGSISDLSSSIAMTIDAGGNVGIGTTNPGSNFHIVSSNSNQLRLEEGSNTGAATIRMITDGTATTVLRRYASGNSLANKFGISMDGGTTQNLLIDNSGNVGIGTTAPGAKLDVNGNILVQGGGTIDTEVAGTLTIGGVTQNGLILGRFGQSTTLAGNVQGFTLAGSITGSGSPNISGIGSLSASTGSFSTSVTSPAIYGGTSASSTLTLAGTNNGTPSNANIILNGLGQGNVGIGTTTPGYRLDVNGAINATSILVNGVPVGSGSTQWANGSGGAISYTGGNVGIGTTAPSYPVEISNNYAGGTNLKIRNTNANAWTGFDLFNSNNTKVAYFGAGNPSAAGGANTVYSGSITAIPFTFNTNDTERMRIDANGNVGIGTTAPSAKLEVVDGVYTMRSSFDTGFQVGTTGNSAWVNLGSANGAPILEWFDTSNNILGLIAASGNMGIGTTNPEATLDVSGYARFGSSTNHVVLASGLGTGDKGIWLDYGDVVANTGIIQVEDQGTAYRDLLLNPYGGNVGIGITNPSYKLDVNGAINATSILVNGVPVGTGGTQWANGGGGKISYSGGNVGIGTTAPAAKLEVTDSGATMRFGSNTGFQVATTGTSAWANIGTIDTSPILEWYDISNNPIGVISNNGNVGIGTTTPIRPLQVVGDLVVSGSGNRLSLASNVGGDPLSTKTWHFDNNSNNLRIFQQPNIGTAGTVYMTMADGGNLGIGTTAPAHKLELASDTTATGGIGFGTDVELYRSAANTLALATGDSLNIVSGSYQAGGSTVIDSSRNLTNIGTISSTYLTSGASYVNLTGSAELRTGGTARISNGGNLLNIGTTQFASNIYTWPASQTSGGFLTTNGSGTLSWTTSIPVTSLAFNYLTGGTNTAAAMVVGSGASLNYTGTGTINASTLGTYAVTALPYVNNVTNATLTRSASAPYTLGLNLGNANTWTAAQTFQAATNFPGSGIWDTSGNVGIGTTTTSSYKLTVSGAVSSTGSMYAGGSMYPGNDTSYYLGTLGSGNVGINFESGNYMDFDRTNDVFRFVIANGLRMAISGSSGNVGIGTGSTSPAYKLHVKGTVCLDLNADGNCTDNTAALSDARFKTNVHTISNGLDLVEKLRGVTFNWNGDAYPERLLGTAPSLGFIAQEVEQILPDLVITDQDGFKYLDYSKLTAVLASAIQEQQSQIQALQSTTNALTMNLNPSGDVALNTSTPTASVSTTGLSFDGVKSLLKSLTFTLTNGSQQILTNSGSFAKVIASTITSGLIETEHAIVNGTLAAKHATIDTLDAQLASFQNLIVREKIVSPVIETGDLIATGTATLSKIQTNEIKAKDKNITLDISTDQSGSNTEDASVQQNGTTSNSQTGALAKVIFKGLQGKTVTTIDAAGNINTAGDLSVKNASISGSIVSSVVIANNVQAQTATIAGTLAAHEATIEGKLIAKEIQSENITNLQNQVSSISNQTSSSLQSMEELSKQMNDVQKLLGDIKNQPLPSPAYYQNLSSDSLASGSASLADASVVNLWATGSVNATQAVITDQLTVSQIIVHENSISSLTNELKLAALSQINLMNGAVIIAKDGTITSRGEIIAQGGVRTNEIKAISPDQDVSVVLGARTASGSGEMENAKLKVKDVLGTTVASIDASGSASFQNLSLNKYLAATSSASVLSAPDNFNKNGLNAPAIETDTQSAGIGIIPSGQPEVAIYNTSVTKDSLIYLTPVGENAPQLTVVQKEACTTKTPGCKPYFTVSVGNGIHSDVKFNWLIIH